MLILQYKRKRDSLNFPLYIAKRYLRSKSSNNAINIITLIATLGVIVSAIALFIVLSVFSGLKDFSLSFIRTADPDLKITSVEGKSFYFDQDLEKKLMQDKIKAYSKVIEERVFLSYGEKSHIASIKGVDSNYLGVNRLDTAVYFGNWVNYDAKYTVVVGSAISSALSIGTYDFLDYLKIYVPKPGKGYITNPKTAFSQVAAQTIGIYRLTDDIDKKFVYSNLELAQDLLNYENNQVSAIEIKVADGFDARKVQNELQETLGSDFKIRTRQQLNSVFYKMLNTENLVSYLVFTLILIIALFNVIGAIVMMIIDKRENLKTLFHLGATVREIRRVFVLQGFLLTLFGLSVGLFLAIPFVLLQKKYGFIMITQSLAYPVEFRLTNVLVVIATIVILGYLASKIASARISRKLVAD
ncbi:ABC transporter permease [Lutimonas zeaxanthinifaciens]|uniref:ABC transporter permease n=1 Tax=Lutimonas zeaxanthinifaciens TaxID=3060215 RepID=UPI00265C93AE|nr:ABC transporter permease [Lutimonas sp. YSD2104]WKK66599.1 ABC transporter permease [Lutimonas sp. YSD2104]